MENTENKISSHLNRSIKIIDEGIIDVVKGMVFEEANLKDLVGSDDHETQKHLSELRGLVDGLHGKISKLWEELLKTQGLAAELGSVDEAPDNSEAQKVDVKTDLSAREAAEKRHDEPVSFGGILRSLLMANEPAQRERSE